MKIVETITPINADKTFLGPRELRLEYDTETGRLVLDAPAMLSHDPIVQLDELLEKLNGFKELGSQ